MATTTEFMIIKGKALDFIIVVKENGSFVPLVLNVADTFTFSLVDKKTGVKAITDKAMIISSATAGEVSGSISAIESDLLAVKTSSPEDGYLPRANYRLVVSGDTISQGEMSATIENVYVVVG